MVEQVIEEVAESFEATWRERGELADKVEALEKQIAELRQREDLLTQTLSPRSRPPPTCATGRTARPRRS